MAHLVSIRSTSAESQRMRCQHEPGTNEGLIDLLSKDRANEHFQWYRLSCAYKYTLHHCEHISRSPITFSLGRLTTPGF